LLSPGPAIKYLTSGINLATIGSESRRTCRPLRGSSNLPIKPIVFSPVYSADFLAFAYLCPSIPFGITTITP